MIVPSFKQKEKKYAATAAFAATDDNDYDDGADSFASHPMLMRKKHADLMIIFRIFSTSPTLFPLPFSSHANGQNTTNKKLNADRSI